MDSHANNRTQAKWSRRWLIRLSISFVLATLAAPLLFTILINLANNRSYLIEAQTGQITLTFGEGPNQWRLPDARLCLPSIVPRLEATDACGAAYAPDGPSQEWLIDWKIGNTVTVQIEPDGMLILTSETGTAEVPTGARLLVSAGIWESVGILLFQANATVGSDMAPGVRHYLWSGRWEVREAGAATFLFRSETEVVKSGILSAGARVDIFKREKSDATKGYKPAINYGHISRRSDAGPMDVVLLSEFEDTHITVRHYGVGQAVDIRPDWVDIAISSPMLLAIAAVFPLLASLGLFLTDAVRRTEAPDGPKKPIVRNSHRNIRRIIRHGKRRR